MPRKILFRNIPHIRQLPYHNLHLMSSNRVIPPFTPLVLKQKENVLIRNMTKKDLQLVFQWAEKEGWNPGKHEIEPLYAADPGGYYILEVNGEPTASLAAVKYSQNLAFLGLFISIKKGQGYGSLLWDVVTRKLEICSSIGLNAVMEQIERYRKSGFSSSFLNTRWTGKLENITSERGIKKKDVFLTDKFSTKDLIAYDSKIFSTPRTAFLTQWLNMPESHTIVALDNQKNIIGYGVISRTVESNSYKIAPLLANSEIVADQLYRNLCRFCEKNAKISIDISETNPYASKIIERFKLSKMFDTMRMYKGKTQEVDKNKILGLTSLEIGN